MVSAGAFLGAAAVIAAGAAVACFLGPVGAVAMMKAPGAGGLLISRAAFLASTKLYFHLLRTAGAAAAVAAFAA